MKKRKCADCENYYHCGFKSDEPTCIIGETVITHCIKEVIICLEKPKRVHREDYYCLICPRENCSRRCNHKKIKCLWFLKEACRFCYYFKTEDYVSYCMDERGKNGYCGGFSLQKRYCLTCSFFKKNKSNACFVCEFNPNRIVEVELLNSCKKHTIGYCDFIKIMKEEGLTISEIEKTQNSVETNSQKVTNWLSENKDKSIIYSVNGNSEKEVFEVSLIERCLEIRHKYLGETISTSYEVDLQKYIKERFDLFVECGKINTGNEVIEFKEIFCGDCL